MKDWRSLCDKIKRFNDKLNELSHNETFETPVSKLHCFKEIDTTSAMTIHIEISNHSRFLLQKI